jgi:altronate dehydratase
MINKPGLNLFCTRGNVVESTATEVGSGANIVLLTTDWEHQQETRCTL